MVEAVPYEGAEMTDDLGTSVWGRKSGCPCQYYIHRNVVDKGWREAVGLVEGSPVVPGYDEEVHLAPERHYCSMVVLPVDGARCKVQHMVQESPVAPIAGDAGAAGVGGR